MSPREARPPAVRVFSGAVEDGPRREFVYGDDLLVFKGVEPMAELCAFTDELIQDALAVSDPETAQFELDREDYLGRIGALQKQYRRHPRVKELFLAALECVGVDLRRTGRLGVHRDTWASNVYAQTNWWAPIYPITPGRTIAFYPGYWKRPLENSRLRR